jgi:hypothetical protein
MYNAMAKQGATASAMRETRYIQEVEMIET